MQRNEVMNKVDTDAIKANNPIAEVVTRYGVQLRKQGRVLVGFCPFHKETNPSFTVWPETGTWHCFGAGCGRGGDVISFVMEIEGVDFREACRILGEKRLPELPRRLPPDWTEVRPRPLREPGPAEMTVMALAARIYHTTLVEGPKGPGSPYGYLLSRGLTPETIQQFQIGYCAGNLLERSLRYLQLSPKPAEDVGLLRRRNGRTWEFFARRIVFVERDAEGRVIHMSGRALGPARAKYLFLPDITKPLYGWSRVDPRRPVFVVEGIFCHMTLWQWGYQGVAILGASLKREHALALKQVERLVFIPDNDPGGEGLKAAEQWREAVGHGIILRLPDDVDDLNDLAQRPDGEEVFYELVKRIEL